MLGRHCFIISCNFSCHLISKQNLNSSYAKCFSAIAFPTKMARKSNASKNQEEFGAVLWNRNLRIFALSIESIQVRRFSWIHPNAKSKSNSKKVLFLSIRHKLPVNLGSYLPGFTGKLCLWNQSYNLPVNVGKCPKWLVNYDCDFRVVIYQWNRANVDLVTLKVQSWLVNFVFEIRGTIYQ